MNLPTTIISIIENLVLMLPALLVVAYVTVAERKTMASMQRRLGPNAVGYYGLLQAFADALKLILKEYVAPTQANLILFFLGPVVTLIFALLGYAVIPYGPGLSLGDMELGILFMLAVSSLSTYGILLAGFSFFFRSIIYILNLLIRNTCSANFIYTYMKLRNESRQPLVYLCFDVEKASGEGASSVSNIKQKFIVTKTALNYNTYRLQHFNMSRKKAADQARCFIHTTGDNNNSNINKEQCIQDLFKDRIAPVIPFDRNLIKGSCLNYTDKICKAKFHKKWGSKVGIYLIEYKYYPNIYYIGRTNLFKKRLFEHSKAESNSKFHLFMRLMGIEHFNIHILEVCAETKLGERETYYLQKYVPILNSVFSSTITEGVIKQTLLLKLKDLRGAWSIKYSGSSLVYVYEWTEIGINRQPTIYNSSNEASRSLSYPISGILRYKNTSIPYRGKLFFNYPITEFNQVFEQTKKLTPKGLLNRVISTQVWAYDAINLELIKGSPFPSINKAAKALGIPRATLDLVLDKARTAGSKAIYAYSRRLSVEDLKPLLAKVGYLQLGLKVPVYVYDANNLELVNNAPFDSLLETANYFGVDYRTIARHLNTNKAIKRSGRLVYLFKNKLDVQLSKQLLAARKIGDSRNYNTKVWAYKADSLELINNCPFDSISSAVNYIGIDKSTIYRNLDSSKPVVLRKVKLTVYFLTKEMSSDFKEKKV